MKGVTILPIFSDDQCQELCLQRGLKLECRPLEECYTAYLREACNHRLGDGTFLYNGVGLVDIYRDTHTVRK